MDGDALASDTKARSLVINKEGSFSLSFSAHCLRCNLHSVEFSPSFSQTPFFTSQLVSNVYHYMSAGPEAAAASLGKKRHAVWRGRERTPGMKGPYGQRPL